MKKKKHMGQPARQLNPAGLLPSGRQVRNCPARHMAPKPAPARLLNACTAPIDPTNNPPMRGATHRGKKAVPPVKAVCFHDCPTAFLPRATAFLPRNCVHCNAQALRYLAPVPGYLPNEYR